MRLLFLTGLTISLSFPGLADAQTDWPGPLLWKADRSIERKVGDELIHRGEISWVSKYKELALNQPRNYERTRQVTWEYVREIQSVRRGRSSRDRLEMKKWSWLEQDGLADRSLEGYEFLYRGVDSGRSRRTVRSGKEALSAKAKGWAEHNLRNFEESLFLAVSPNRALVRKGDRWSVDPVELAVTLKLDELSRVDAKKSKLTGVLREIRLVKDVTVGRYDIEGELVLGQLAYTQRPWTSGGVLRLKITFEGPLEPFAVQPYMVKISGVLKGSGEIQGASGEKINREFDWTMTGQWSRSLP